MKKIGTLNSHLSTVIARMGHTDKLVICDSGLPIPRSSVRVDLALAKNIPSFLDSLRVILEELCVEQAILASELEKVSPEMYKEVKKLLGNIPVSKVSHEEFKILTQQENTTAFVRTGEATPYANVILIAGVTFK